jgi:hypothetical protein
VTADRWEEEARRLLAGRGLGTRTVEDLLPDVATALRAAHEAGVREGGETERKACADLIAEWGVGLEANIRARGGTP